MRKFFGIELKIRLKDWSQWENKVLMSDNNWLATWRLPTSVAPTVTAQLWNWVDLNLTNHIWKYLPTWTTITLPANSKYIVNVNMLMSTKSNSGDISCIPGIGQWLWLRTTFTYTNECLENTNDFVGRNSLISWYFWTENWTYWMLNGSVILHNKTNQPKTYHYCAGLIEYYWWFNCTIYWFGNRFWLENQIYAIPIN